VRQTDALVIVGAAALLVIGGAWWSRRARALPATAKGDKFAPFGFAWDVKRGAYTRANNAGEVEVYAAGVYL
jgi:hypothetical protein